MGERGGRRGVQTPLSFVTFDIVVVPFPYSDRLAEKRRPALVVSAPTLEDSLQRLWVAMITSDRGRPLLGDMTITDLGAAGLPAASLVRASKIATIETERVLRQAGRLSPTDIVAARAALRICAGF
jgi:mRNA interferase MazF